MFDRPLKTIMSGPFVARPKPLWFTTHRAAPRIARRMVAFEATPSWWKLPGIVRAALDN
jgi:hypothetical protein